MARKVHLDTGYIFVPSANRITIDKAIPREKLLLITNLNTNTVLFNFSDPNLRVSSYTRTRDTQIAVTGTPGGTTVTNLWPQITPIVGQRITGYGIPAGSYITSVTGTSITLSSTITADPYINAHTPATIFGTIIILNYNTSGMNITDKLQIFVDEYEETMKPAEVLIDPVSKMRVSTPQALIDTDFEYGLQPTKWESLNLVSNRPSYFVNPTTPISFSTATSTSSSRTINVNVQTALTGTLTTSSASTTVTGTTTLFTSQLKTGSILYSNAGVFLGVISSVASDTSATLKANALSSVTANSAFATGQKFADNGAPGTGIFGATGTLSSTTSNATLTGSSTKFLAELRVGDRIFDNVGNLIGTIAAISTDTIAGLAANAAVTSNGTFEISQYTPGNPIYTQYTTLSSANGSFVISGPSSGSLQTHCTFTYDQEVTASATGTILDVPNTIIYPGSFYSGQQYVTGANPLVSDAATLSTITVTTTYPHGLLPGSPIFVINSNNAAANGNWYVARIPTPFTFEYVTSSTVATSPIGGTIYSRPVGLVAHRAWDGGVKISAGTTSPFSTMIRQSRRYFRYQSGKGIQYSTGTILKPSLTADSLVSNGTTVLVSSREAHYLYPGAVVSISGAVSTNGSFNGTFTVSAIDLTATTFRYTPTSAPTAQTAGGFPINISVTSWTNASSRLGMFDNQNGFYFRYDGNVLSACRRSSTDQLAGTVRVTTGNANVEGINTRFASQLKPGNNIVIRGQTYLVTSITADSGIGALTISPEYRGTSIASPSSATISKTIDYEVPSTDWNIDKCDGSGPSGFTIDLSRMQMFYIDYSWYGAGAIRYGFKDQRGEVIYVHRTTHANNKTEAYMRSGNMPARYQTDTIPYSTILTATLSSATVGGGTISVQDTTGFPSSGYAWIVASGSAAPELIQYSSTSSTSLTIATSGRALAGIATTSTALSTNNLIAVTSATGIGLYQHVSGAGVPIGTYVIGISGLNIYVNNNVNIANAAAITFKSPGATTAQTYSYSLTAPIAVYSYNPSFAPNISHWGSSVIMDGRYDDDKSLIFTAGMQTTLSVAQNAVNALISVRVAPSVDSGATGLLGFKEIINRMQLSPDSIGTSADGRFLVELRLNGQVSGGTWQSAGGSSLAQVCYHSSNTTISGGEALFSFYTNTGTGYIVTGADLSKARDLGNSILGGGTSTSASSGIYPDGPDVLTVVVRNIDSASKNVVSRFSWKEAQA